MLNFEELKRLEQLKKKLVDEIKVVDYEFTEDELINIFKEIETVPIKDRTVPKWQEIVKLKTGAKLFRMYEALEYSDINYVHQQIQDLLNKK
jgi:hypothetical protein